MAIGTARPLSYDRQEGSYVSWTSSNWPGCRCVLTRRLSVSNATSLDEAVVCTGFPYGQRDRLPEMVAAFGRFTELARGTRRLGSAALDLAYVAAGRLDVFWEQGLKPWDIAAGIVMVREAGGLATRFDGSPLDIPDGEILACTPSLRDAAREVLREARSRH